jgi:hypothetical protein
VAQVARKSHLRRIKNQTGPSDRQRLSLHPTNQTVECGGDTFRSDSHINKSLVPHHQLTVHHTNLKRVAPQLRQVCVPMRSVARGGNTPRTNEGYYHVQLCGAMAHKLFAMSMKAQAKFQPRLTGVTLSVWNSPKIVSSAHRD